MAASGKVVDLRKLLAERFPHAAASGQGRLITGLSFLDQTIGGGLPKGAITELISPQVSAGSASLIHVLIQAQRGAVVPVLGPIGILSAVGRTRCGEPALVDSAGETPACYTDKMSVPQPIALIDGRDSFDPQPLGNASLRHLLWVRCNKAFEAIKAADLLLRDGNFPLVIVDLVLNPPEELRKIPQTSWYRLQRLVEPTSAVCLVLTRQSMVGSAQLKIVLGNLWTLETFEKDNATSRLQFRIQRSHLSCPESALTGTS
jgi:RecA/RadA recombinase